MLNSLFLGFMPLTSKVLFSEGFSCKKDRCVSKSSSPKGVGVSSGTSWMPADADAEADAEEASDLLAAFSSRSMRFSSLNASLSSLLDSCSSTARSISVT